MREFILCVLLGIVPFNFFSVYMSHTRNQTHTKYSDNNKTKQKNELKKKQNKMLKKKEKKHITHTHTHREINNIMNVCVQ